MVEKEPFQPMKALWLSLPTAVFYSVAFGIWARPWVSPFFRFAMLNPDALSDSAWVNLFFAGMAWLMFGLLYSIWAAWYCSKCRGHRTLRSTLLTFHIAAMIGYAVFVTQVMGFWE